jgi:16S rRNA (guanine527-N7)-methyltransferase
MTRSFPDVLTARSAVVGLHLSSAQIDKLDTYYAVLARWNRRLNLTALELDGYPEPTIDRLIVEPCLIARWFPPGPVYWFDFGSGGGSPAVPVKIARPDARLAMVESRARKAAFLRELVRTLELSSARVEAGRIEDLRAVAGNLADIITMRAVRPTPEIVEAAVRLLRPGGSWLIVRSAGAPEQLLGAPPFDLIETAPLVAESQLEVFRRR